MSDDTKIEWTDATWNPVRGCSRVSEGCRNCYAEQFASRNLPGYEGLAKNGKWTGVVRLVPERLDQPLRWKRPRKIFVNSMSDLFHESLSNEQIAAVFGVMAAAPQHTFQVLTKRPARMVEWFKWAGTETLDTLRECANVAMRSPRSKVATSGNTWPLPNLWLGVSVENQAAADERIPLLLQTPAAVRFLSCEPLLGTVTLREEWLHGRFIECPDETQDKDTDPCNGCDGLGNRGGDYCGAVRGPKVSWVIVGGESGPGARPMHPDWARSLRDQCFAAGVPFFFKQWGEWRDIGSAEHFDGSGRRPHPPNERWLNLAGGHGFHGDRVVLVSRVGKRAAGRHLGGIEHSAFPETKPCA
jgi:protein gp37